MNKLSFFYCTKCIVPSTRPSVKFDSNGVCIATNAVFNVSRNTIGWYDLKTNTTGFIKI